MKKLVLFCAFTSLLAQSSVSAGVLQEKWNAFKEWLKSREQSENIIPKEDPAVKIARLTKDFFADPTISIFTRSDLYLFFKEGGFSDPYIDKFTDDTIKQLLMDKKIEYIGGSGWALIKDSDKIEFIHTARLTARYKVLKSIDNVEIQAVP